MRLVGVLAMALFAPLAHAEGGKASDPAASADSADVAPASAKVPLRVVRVMPESRQALLFDRVRATHVLAEIGGKVDGYVVEDIDDEQVTLSMAGKQIVLVVPEPERGPERGFDRRRDRPAARPGVQRTDSVSGEPTPVDPYGPYSDAARGEGASGPAASPRAIEPGEGGVRVVQAPSGTAPAARPIEPGDDGVRVASAPSGGAGSAAPGGAPPATSPSSNQPAIRSVTMAGDPATTPTLPAAATAGPATSAAIASAPGGSNTTTAASAPPPASPAASPTAAAPMANPAPGSMAAPAPRAATPSTPPTRAADPRTVTVRPRTVADQQALDARAMADVFSADSPTRATRRPAGSAATAPAAAASAAPQPSQPSAPAPGSIVLGRADVDGALGDFTALSAAVHGSFTATGLKIDSVGDGTIFQRAGLRAGDVVASVDGVQLHTLDDAANLYARAGAAKAFTVQIIRAGTPVTLRIAIQ